MKKLILLALIGISALAASAQHTTARFSPPKDNTGRSLSYKLLTPTYAAVVYVQPSNYETIVLADTLTGTQTDSASVTGAWVGDRLTYIFQSDTASGGHVVTFGNHMVTSGTLTVDAEQKASIQFIFDGVAWVACGREKQ